MYKSQTKCDSVSDTSAVQALTGSNSDSVTGGQVQSHHGVILPKLYSQPNADVFSTILGHMLNIKEMLSHFTPLCSSSHISRCSTHYPNTHTSPYCDIFPAVPKITFIVVSVSVLVKTK